MYNLEIFIILSLIGLFCWNLSINSKLSDIKMDIEILYKKHFQNQNKQAKEPKTIAQKSKPVEPQKQQYTYKAPLQKTKQTKEQGINFEKLFMENVFNKIGALAVIIGVGLFIKLVSPFVVFTPIKQVIFAYILGGVFATLSIKTHKKEMLNYAEVLMGTAIGIFFITTFAATSYYNILPQSISLSIATALVIASYFIAKKYKTFSTMVIGIIAGYITPFIISQDANTSFIFSYFIFINIISLVYTYNNKSKFFINYANIGLTFATINICIFNSQESYNFIFPVLLWGAYIVYDFLSIKKDYNNHNKILSGANYFVLLFFTTLVFNNAHGESIGLIIATIGAIYFIIGHIFNKKSTNTLYYSASILAVLFATYFIDNQTARICVWALEGMSIAILANRSQKEYLEKWAISAMSLSLTAALLTATNTYEQAFFNLRAISFGVPTICAFLSALILQKQNSKFANFLKFLSLTFIYMLFVLEINTLLSIAASKGSINKSMIMFSKNMINIIIAFSYSLSAYRIFNITNFKLFAFASISIFAGAAICLLFVGSGFPISDAYIPIINIRFAAFGAAILSAIFLTKWTASSIFKYIAIILGFFLISNETLDATNALTTNAKDIIVSISWIIYAAALMSVGIYKNIKSLKLSGIWIISIAAAKIVFLDMAQAEAVFRTISFLLLGSVLMAVSFFYTKNKKSK